MKECLNHERGMVVKMWNAVLQKNFDHISENKKALKELIALQNEKINAVKSDAVKIEFGSEVIEGRKILYAIKEEKVFQLGSLYDDKTLIDVWFSQLSEYYYNSKLLMFGLGNGMYVRKFLEEIPKTEGIVIYEPSMELFYYIINTIDISDLLENPKVHIYVEGLENLIIKDFLYKHIVFSDIKGLIFHDYLNYKNLYTNKFVAFFEDCQLLVNSINATNIVWERFGESFYQNTMQNLSFFLASHSLQDLYLKLPKEIPAIIVAAGPSLDKNIQELEKAKGKALIIAVDSALKALFQHDIIPDLFVTIDGKKLADHFDDPRVTEIPVVCNFNSNAEVLEKHTGIKFFINDLNPHINKVLNPMNKQIPIASTGGSVANTAFSIAEMLGFTTIIMVGQDLAYTDNKTHASGTVRGIWNLGISHEDYVEVDGYYGGKVRSSNEFWLYRDWFQKELSLKQNITMINATEGGAKIEGAEQATLAEAIGQYCVSKFDAQHIIAGADFFLNNQEFQQFSKEISESVDQMRQIIEYAQKTVRIHYSMLALINANKYKSSEIVKLFQQTKELGAFIEKIPAMYYIECRIQNRINALTNDIHVMNDSEFEEIKEATSKSMKYFEIILEAAKTTLPDFEERISQGIKNASILRGNNR